MHASRSSAPETVIGSAYVPRLIRSLRRHPAESSRVRVRAYPLLFSVSASGLGTHRHPPPPNNSFKPTPCHGVGRVLCATLAHVRRPATGRLNSSVMRGLAMCSCGSWSLQHSLPSNSLAVSHSSLLSVPRSRRSPSGETALRLVVRAGWHPLDETARTGQSTLRMGGALGFGGRSWPPTILAPSCVNRLPIVCANKT